MRIKYAAAISESDGELEQAERDHRGRKEGIHVRVLRLLKSGQAHNLREAAALVGYSYPQVIRWWERYRAGGLAALLQPAVHPGRPSQMTPDALTRLQTAMEQGEIATIEQARQYVATHDQIVYHSQDGIAKVLHKHHITKKTGRRRHRKASAEAQQAFKKTLPA
jgi:transposase